MRCIKGVNFSGMCFYLENVDAGSLSFSSINILLLRTPLL